nr:MAG TPA: hypothetical protein [Caudoviricetes sp.]
MRRRYSAMQLKDCRRKEILWILHWNMPANAFRN